MRVLIAVVLAGTLLFVPRDTHPTVQSIGDWTVDAGIYGTYNHFGNPLNMPLYYACGIAYELWYMGSDPIADLDVAVLFPDRLRGVVVPGTDEFATGWRRPPLQIGHGGLVEAALGKHVGGAMGAACKGGPGDLDALRGSLLRVGWRTASGIHEATFTVDRVRGEVTLCGGLFTRDGQIHPVWGGGRC